MLLVRLPAGYEPERRYVLDTVLGEFLGLDWQLASASSGAVEIVDAADPDGPRLELADGLFATDPGAWLQPGCLPLRPLEHWSWKDLMPEAGLLEPELPVLYGSPPFLERTEGGFRVGIDLLGGIFLQLTRMEELILPVRDEHGRFPPGASLAVQEGFLERPLVNEYTELLRTLLLRLWPGLPVRNHAPSTLVSHDIDWPLHPARSTGSLLRGVVADLAIRREPARARARLRAAGARRRGTPERDPYNTFAFLMRSAEARGRRSAFYFMAGQTDKSLDGDYDIDSRWLRSVLGELHARGHEVGLHPSYHTYRDPAALARERDRLLAACEQAGVRQPAWGGRQHFLRWENPTTWRAWEHCGLSYDASLGYARDPGFRAGVCFDYPVYDLQARRQLRLRERPLVLMDVWLTERSPSEDEDGIVTMAQLRQRCHRFGGQFTLLWHNNRLITERERRLFLASL